MKNHFAPRLTLVLAAMLSLPACSFLFVTPPREQYGPRHGNCTSSLAAPGVDFLFGALNGLAAVYVATQDEVRYRYQLVGVGATVGALWLSSAIYGIHNTQQCAALLQDDELGTSAHPAWLHPAPPRLRPAPVPPPPGARPPLDAE